MSSSHAPNGAEGARGVNGGRVRDVLPGSPRHGSGRPGIALAIMLSAQLMIILDMTVVNIALPHIQANLHFSANAAVAAAISRAWFCRASARSCSAGRGGTWSDVLVICLEVNALRNRRVVAVGGQRAFEAVRPGGRRIRVSGFN